MSRKRAVSLRLSTAERIAWLAAARRDGRTLSAWIRHACAESVPLPPLRAIKLPSGRKVHR
jgi:hypothetical protein